MSARTVLVTGATGFVGSNIVRRFGEAGDQVVAIDLADPDTAVMKYVSSVRERVAFVRCDLRDETWHHGLPQQHFDCVVHAAAITNTGEDEELKNAKAAVEVNILGSMHVALWAMNAKPARVLHIGSGAAYGRITEGVERLREDMHSEPETVYAVTKYATEKIMLRLAKKTGLPLAAIRLPSQYGPMERNTGVRTRLSSLQSWCSAAIRDEQLSVNKDSFPRDFTYVCDVADAIYQLSIAPMLRYDLYNIGTGVASSPQDIVTAILGAIPTARVQYTSYNGVTASDRKPVDIERIQSDTGWKPAHTLKTGVAEYIEWLRQNPESTEPRHA